MRAPGFWSNPPDRPGAAARALAPASWVWRMVTAARVARPPAHQAGIPVICVGNLTAGGTGKTPVVSYLIERLAAHGIAAHVLSRGHGGQLAGPVRVNPARHGAADVGDEPLLLSGFGPAWVARDRAAGARAAEAAGAEALILDDGFQNPGLARDLSILVIDAEAGFGNGRVIPAGPLREPVSAGLARAGLVILLGPEAARARFLDRHPEVAALPRAEGALAPLRTGIDFAGLRVLAFAGIGRPAKFFATLRALGAEVVAIRAFADHAAYPRAMVQRMLREAAEAGAMAVTTEKDAVRLPADLRPRVLTLPVRLALTDPARLDQALQAVFTTKQIGACPPPRSGGS